MIVGVFGYMRSKNLLPASRSLAWASFGFNRTQERRRPARRSVEEVRKTLHQKRNR